MGLRTGKPCGLRWTCGWHTSLTWTVHCGRNRHSFHAHATTQPNRVSIESRSFIPPRPIRLLLPTPPPPPPRPAPIGETMRLWRRKTHSGPVKYISAAPSLAKPPRTEKKTDSRNDRQRKTQFVNSFPLINNGDAGRMRGTLPLSPYELLGGQTARAGRGRNAPPLWVGRDR